MYDFLDKIGLKAVLEAIKGKMPTSLPANGGNADYATKAGNADTVNGRHAYRISTLDANGNPWDANVQNINDAYLQWDGSKYFKLRTFGGSLTAVDYATNAGNADTVDGLHADDFVNATNRNSTTIPSNADVPAWIYANGKRYQLYVTNSDNIGLTNVPNNSVDWVWYWFDGINIIAREWATGKYYICDTINGVFSGWKDIYTSGYKPYVTGDVPISEDGKCYTNHGFTPSVILYNLPYTTSTLFDNVKKATTFDTTSFTPSSGAIGATINYIIFK